MKNKGGETMKTYRSSGLVYGNYWGGGEGAYPAENGYSTNLKELKEDIKNGIKDGSLDSGMGYESLKGAVMKIETIRSEVIKGREYTNNSFKRVYFGNLTHQEKCFLASCDF